MQARLESQALRPISKWCQAWHTTPIPLASLHRSILEWSPTIRWPLPWEHRLLLWRLHLRVVCSLFLVDPGCPWLQLNSWPCTNEESSGLERFYMERLQEFIIAGVPMYNPSIQDAVPWKISLSFRATNSTLWFKCYVLSSCLKK